MNVWKSTWKGAKKVGDGLYARGSGPYDGSWKGDVRHGTGTQIWDCGPLIGCVHTGEWRDGQPCGRGKLTHVDGSTFDGMVRSAPGKKTAFAPCDFPCVFVRGVGRALTRFGLPLQWKDGLLQGKASIGMIDGSTFLGEFQNGRPNGTCTWTKASEVFKGEREKTDFRKAPLLAPHHQIEYPAVHSGL